MHGLSPAQTEFLVADRLSWMRFCRLGPGDAVPDANTLWDFREALIAAGAFDALFARLDRAITEAGYLPMAGPILDATLVAAPRRRNKHRGGEGADQGGRKRRPDLARQTGQARQKDTDARWTMKFAKPKPAADGRAQIAIAVPAFGYKSHISIVRRHGIIRRARVTDAAAHDGARLREGLIDPADTASDVRADSACRSAENERYPAGLGKVGRVHRRKPPGRAMPKRTARADAAQSAVRARVEHPFAHQNGPMGMVIRTIGIARATATVMLANMGYDMERWCWLDGRGATA